jgi:hypothetical protein
MAWALDEKKLDNFMESVERTINSQTRCTWNVYGDAATAAWKFIGGKGKPTYKALRALPT